MTTPIDGATGAPPPPAFAGGTLTESYLRVNRRSFERDSDALARRGVAVPRYAFEDCVLQAGWLTEPDAVNFVAGAEAATTEAALRDVFEYRGGATGLPSREAIKALRRQISLPKPTPAAERLYAIGEQVARVSPKATQWIVENAHSALGLNPVNNGGTKVATPRGTTPGRSTG